jgi:uncharacterized membrane protein SirB2
MMTLYPYLLFSHIVGAVGIFAALAIEAVAETAADGRVWMGLVRLPFRVGPFAMGMTLVSGVWMMKTAWGRPPWLVAAMVGLVAMAVLGAVSLRRLRRLRAPASGTGPEIPDALRSVRSGLAASLRLRIAIGIGILALMTFKPQGTGASLILAAGTLGGLIASLAAPGTRRSRSMEAPSRAAEPSTRATAEPSPR